MMHGLLNKYQARFWAVILGVAFSGGAMAQDRPAPARYQACMDLAQRFPKDAFEDAIQWRDLGGGDAAEHCAAAALIKLGLYEEAAARLEDLARRINKKPAFKVLLLGQAAQAWLLAEQPAQAEAVATVALKLQPDAADVLLDRAQARAQLGDYAKAKTDLDRVISNDGANVEALAFRASARRYLKDEKGARDDIERALAIDPNHSAGLLERGNLKRLSGDRDGARADWLQVLAIEPNGVAADAARANLEKMDVKTQ